ncbi:MAG: MG2 domain-containing protein, partial [Planctomycetia bacterium]|nr:MG2 domain-containing protein [Planctomycetia bacterium]
MESRLHQQLLELHHGLLPEAEASELRAQIDNDPALNGAWIQAQRELGLIAQAARIEAPPLSLKIDEQQAIRPISSVVRQSETRRAHHQPPAKRNTWGWAIGLAAAVMLLLSLGGFQFHRTRLARLDRELPRVVVAGPARLTPGATNRFTVAASTVAGDPLAVNMVYALYDVDRQANVQLHRQETDRWGRMTIELSGKERLPVNCELRLATAQAGLQSPLATLALPVSEVAFLTKLATDRPSYQPGDDVYFRSVTLRQSDLTPVAAPLQFWALDASGVIVPGSELSGTTDRGIGNGRWTLPADAALGEYRLVA